MRSFRLLFKQGRLLTTTCSINKLPLQRQVSLHKCYFSLSIHSNARLFQSRRALIFNSIRYFANFSNSTNNSSNSASNNKDDTSNTSDALLEPLSRSETPVAPEDESNYGNVRQFWTSPQSLTSAQEEDMRHLASQVIANSRPHLSRAITLVESTNLEHQYLAQSLLSHLYNLTKSSAPSVPAQPKSFRIGITGPPGAGKSTFVNKLGSLLCSPPADASVPISSHNVAVLAIDPSSLVSGGSILGDQTRMFDLMQHRNAYIRPSPNRLSLGGVSDSTTEVSKVFEAAGYDTIFIETVGVGQAEIEVAHCVDMFVLVITPGAGDDLQGIKRGIMEMADLVVVNKAEGDLLMNARHIKADYKRALQLSHPRRKNWTPKVVLSSCFDDVRREDNNNVLKVWNEVEKFKNAMMQDSDELYQLRREQNKYAAWKYVWRSIRQHVEGMKKSNENVGDVEERVMREEVSPREGSHHILNQIWGK